MFAKITHVVSGGVVHKRAHTVSIAVSRMIQYSLEFVLMQMQRSGLYRNPLNKSVTLQIKSSSAFNSWYL